MSEIYLKDICGMVYYENRLYYTFDENGEEIIEFGTNPFPDEVLTAKVQTIQSIKDGILFYIYI